MLWNNELPVSLSLKILTFVLSHNKLLIIFILRCSGDPHCNNFDGTVFHFMGKCKYDKITTDCLDNELPASLTPFNVKQKQIGSRRKPSVAYIKYMEVNVKGKQYRLMKKKKGVIPFTIDGTAGSSPYNNEEDGVSVNINGGKLVFSTTFGLTLNWDGKTAARESLCDAYKGFVCGLCGNGDGKKDNDFVDREKKNVELKGNKYTKFFNWGSEWRTIDDSPDADPAT